jgi:enoyl-CoA hydratase/carnithine racemase
MWLGITEQLGHLAADPSVRLLLVRGAGDHFCAGADIVGLGDASATDYRSANAAAEEALASFPRPTIAVIKGACVGGGAGIAVACDLRIADTTSCFGITPARLGIVYPAQATERVVRLIGPSAAKHLLYTAEIIDADRAARIGLVDEIVDPDRLDHRVGELTGLLVHQRSLLTQMASKEIVDEIALGGQAHPATEARWQRIVASSADPAEGIAAFVGRRPPRFTWTPADE